VSAHGFHEPISSPPERLRDGNGCAHVGTVYAVSSLTPATVPFSRVLLLSERGGGVVVVPQAIPKDVADALQAAASLLTILLQCSASWPDGSTGLSLEPTVTTTTIVAVMTTRWTSLRPHCPGGGVAAVAPYVLGEATRRVLLGRVTTTPRLHSVGVRYTLGLRRLGTTQPKRVGQRLDADADAASQVEVTRTVGNSHVAPQTPRQLRLKTRLETPQPRRKMAQIERQGLAATGAHAPPQTEQCV
jgi:hypothetical protein